MVNVLDSIKEIALETLPETIRIREDIHKHPETGYALERTSNLVASKLESFGIATKTKIGKSGVVGDIYNPSNKKYIAFRADMDALDMEELGGPVYKSIHKNKAHMCGHDGHTAMLLGAAELISRLKDKLKVNVRFIFQPSEEQPPSGAFAMIKDGVMDGVEEIYAIHVDAELEEEKISLRRGIASANADVFKIKIIGKGNHGAYPQYAIDPIVIGSQFVTCVQSIISRNVDPFEPAVISITKFNGGTATNVIPNEVEILGTVRTFKKEQQALIHSKMESLLEALTKANNAKFEIEYKEFCPSVIMGEPAFEKSLQASKTIVGEENTIILPRPTLAAEDFAYFSHRASACMIGLGIRNESKGFVHTYHSPYFDFDSNVLRLGVEYFSHIALLSS